MTSTLPRVLILSDEGPQTGSAGGLLLHRLFRDYPPERIGVLARYVPTIGDPLPGVSYQKLLVPWHRFESSRFFCLKRSLRAWGLVPPASLARLDGMLGGFAPEVVYCVMQHAQYYDTAHRFAQHRGLPLVIAVHDVNDEFEPVLPWARAAARRRDGKIYRTAVRRLCISPEMERLCAARYGVAGSVLYPNRSEDLHPRPFEIAGTLRRPGTLTIGFAGNLNYGYGEGLVQVLPAIRAARARLIIYGRPPGGAAAPLAAATDCCDLRGFVPAAEAWAGIQKDCDAVWLPYPDPAGSMEALYSYHFPSKLPEYLALGMPVIVTGPDYATGFQWARRNSEATICAGTKNLPELTALLQRLALDGPWRQNLAEQGWHAGERDFAPRRIVSEFYANLAARSDSAVNIPESSQIS